MENNHPMLIAKLGSPVMLALIATIWLVYLMQVMTGTSAFNPSTDSLLAWGGSMATLSLTTEPWRLFTNIFVHAGFIHLLANSYMLFLIGDTAERLYGRLLMLLLYLAGGIVASLASAVWQSFHIEAIRYTPSLFGALESVVFNHVVSIGASGAIMALCGALLVKVLARQTTESNPAPEANKALRNALIQIVAINLVLGFVIEGVDQAAHIGGFVGGMVMAGGVSLVADRPRVFAPILIIAITSIIVVAVLGASRQRESLLAYQQAFAEEQNVAEEQRIAERKLAEAAQSYRAMMNNLPAPARLPEAAGRVIKFGGCPASMTVSDNNVFAYIVDPVNNRLVLVNLQTGKVEREIRGSNLPARKSTYRKIHGCVGSGASSLAVLPEQQLLLVPSLYRDSLAIFDSTSLKLIRKIAVGPGPHGMVVSNRQKRAYVSNESNNTISVIDLEKWSVIHTLRLKAASNSEKIGASMWLSGDDTLLFYYNQDTSDYDVYDTQSFAFLRSYPFTGSPYVLRNGSASSDMMYALKVGSFYTISSTSLEIDRRWEMCAPTAATSFDVHRGNGVELLATTHADDHEFYEVKMADLGSLVTFGAYPVPSEPVQVKFGNDGKTLFALAKEGTISILDTSKRMRTQNNDISLCVPPEYLPEETPEEPYRGNRYEYEINALGNAVATAFDDPSYLQNYLDVSGEIAADSPLVERYAFDFANHLTSLLVASLQRKDHKSAAKIVQHYVNQLLPKAGAHEKTSDLASTALVVAVANDDETLAQIVFDKLLGKDFSLESERHPILVYNIACFYAVKKQKPDMIRAIQRAVALGQKSSQFLSDSDFEFYWNDADFRNAIAGRQSPQWGG